MGFGSKKSSGKSGKSGSASASGSSSSSSSSQLFPDAPIVRLVLTEWDTHDWGNSSDAFADWMNARWKKSGYSLSPETIYEILKCNGRHAFRGIGDHRDGEFRR